MVTVYMAHLEIEIDYKPNSIWLIFYQFMSPVTVPCMSGSPTPSGPRWCATSRNYLDFCVSASASVSVSVSAGCFFHTLIMTSNLICLWHHYCSWMGTNIHNSSWKVFWKWELLIIIWENGVLRSHEMVTWFHSVLFCLVDACTSVPSQGLSH
jgi:hypothetical protein